MKVFLVLLLAQVGSAGKYSLKFYLTASSGVATFPDFVAVSMLNEVELAYYDSSMRTTELRQDWMRKLAGEDPHRWDRNKQNCVNYQQTFIHETASFKERFNQTGGVHVIQEMAGCEWDDETGNVKGYQQYGYNGEDFVSLDLKTLTWIAPIPQAVITKHKWDEDNGRNKFWKGFVMQSCPEKLQRYLDKGRSFLERTVPPSVSLLQKSPFSPVSCHATGFYPNRAEMFWRKDGEEIHEDVDHGEILPNHDGTFQMRVELKMSSVRPEDWSRYDCVFQISGSVNKIITKLKEAGIRTNWEKPTDVIVPIVAAGMFLAMIIAACGLKVYRKKEKTHRVSELSQKLSPEA